MFQQYNGLVSEELKTETFKDRLYPYVAAWPIFLFCMAICIGVGVLYLRYSIPKYESSTVFLVKNSEQSAPKSNDIINDVLDGKREVNMNNEVMLVSSNRLMERTVRKNNFNISYLLKGRLHSIDVYNEAPFSLEVNQMTDSNRTHKIEISEIDSKGGNYSFNDENTITKAFEWKKPFQVDGQTFTLIPKGIMEKSNAQFIVYWQPVAAVAGNLLNNLDVGIYDSKANAIALTIKTENLRFGEDVLNALFKEFHLANIEERSKLSETTVAFIDERLLNISKELKGVEGNLENYQDNNRLIDIKGQASQSLENANESSKAIKEIRIQQGIASMISKYFSNPANSSKLVPSSLGLGDATLTTLLNQYNETQLKREREAPVVAPNSTVMQDLNAQLANLKSSILENLNNLNKNLSLQENSFRQQTNQYQNFLSSVPHNERVLQEIRRKQSITEGLYLYLLQKREEAAISSTASSIPHYQQIDAATGYGPIEPNKKNILISAALVGFFLAFGFTYLRYLFNDQINSRYEVEKLTGIPLLGEIAHIANVKKQLITVLDRTLVSEQFRAIRTNLFFSLKDKNKKVIMVTSTIGGEGKSIISLNLAAACAVPGKKVALIEFDIRKPGISKAFDWQNTFGITDYLTGKNKDISQLYHVSDELPTLHIYSSGSVPANPADLLLDENLQPMFEELRRRYDYIIIDTAPAGIVCDAFVLGNYSDAVIYVLRQRLSTKKQVDFLNEAARLKRLDNLVLVLNDVKTGYKYGGNSYVDDTKNGYYHKPSKQVRKEFTWNHRQILDVKN